MDLSSARARRPGAPRHPHLGRLANAGDASPEGSSARRPAARGEYVLSTVGVGADFNEYLMTALADAGHRQLLLPQRRRTRQRLRTRVRRRAHDGRVGARRRLAPAHGVASSTRAAIRSSATGGTVRFRPGSLFAGQERACWVTLAVPQRHVGEHELGRVTLAYGEGRRARRRSRSPSAARRLRRRRGRFLRRHRRRARGHARSSSTPTTRCRRTVAREVKAGRRDQALGRSDEFKDEAGA
jgi:hypothetical protein